AAAEVLAALPRTPDNRWVFPGRKKGTHQTNINDSWNRIRKHADLDGVRLHDLRHSFASRALALGEGLPMIGELLGHRQVNTTARYAHLARESVRASTARVADSIGADILTEQDGAA
ncbi:MAG: tyrosine-type recombinase/integrase, partial [Acidobacteria bacterium]|nr:tyrosine-type recombinase/integrase [Acidobacteriota bacterium]